MSEMMKVLTALSESARKSALQRNRLRRIRKLVFPSTLTKLERHIVKVQVDREFVETLTGFTESAFKLQLQPFQREIAAKLRSEALSIEPGRMSGKVAPNPDFTVTGGQLRDSLNVAAAKLRQDALSLKPRGNFGRTCSCCNFVDPP